MFWKTYFYFISYTFLNQIGGKQQESKLHIKFHMSSKYFSSSSSCGTIIRYVMGKKNICLI